MLDVETSVKNKGHPFTHENQLCYTGWKLAGDRHASTLSHLQQGLSTDKLQALVDDATHIVAFNAKFDCHWLERSGVVLDGLRIWDCQYAEFIFNNQRTKYPSLEEAATKYGLGHKLDIIKTEFWDKGIDTPDIPSEIMIEYLEQDINLTEALFLRQQQLFATTEKSKWRLFQLHMEDQIVLRDIERNGIVYETAKSLEKAKDAELQIASIEAELRNVVGNIPINFDSDDHLSALLYGGTIAVDTRVPIGVYKTGAKIGQPRYKIVTHEYQLERQFSPLKGSELKKEGFYSTDEATLKQLTGARKAKEQLGLLEQRAKLEKLRGTYYKGFPKTIVSMGWRDDTLHPTFNQCVAITGRLSSSKPNGQNQPPESKQLCVSRYANHIPISTG